MNESSVPLADRVRPKNITEFFGQKHLLGKGAPLRTFFERGDFPSMIFWGPPGVGKTTLAYLISNKDSFSFIRISAIESGVKEVREILAKAAQSQNDGNKTILFIDEIHRFNKSQQDALLHAVETGIIILIGATTENPSFEVNPALISRCRVYKLHELDEEDIKSIIYNALKNDLVLKNYKIRVDDFDSLYKLSGGDARTALNIVDTAFRQTEPNSENVFIIDKKALENSVVSKIPRYDKNGENHYDTISAFIKSMRGSDPDASVFWLAKMLEAGEDSKFIARRMVIFASEDIGNADPSALNLAVSVFNAVNLIGMPECRINLAQGAIYLASAPKSNASYLAIEKATADIRNGVDTSVPLHLRNAPTKLMKSEGYGKEYKYPHDYPGHFVKVNYLPENFSAQYYNPSDEGIELKIKARLAKLWCASKDNG
ncbi:MAG: replication-associated recombination protein A [Candidatus Kapaibacterium sp.]